MEKISLVGDEESTFGRETAGKLRDADHKYAGEGVSEEQVGAAERLLAHSLPNISKHDPFGKVDTTPAYFAPEDMVNIPPLEESGEEKTREQWNKETLEILRTREIQAKMSGDTEEEVKIGAQIRLLQSRMNPN